MQEQGVVWAPGMDLLLASRVRALAEARGYRFRDAPTAPVGTRIALVPFAHVGRHEYDGAPVLAYGPHTDRMGRMAARAAGARWIVAHRTLGESFAEALDAIDSRPGPHASVAPGPQRG